MYDGKTREGRTKYCTGQEDGGGYRPDAGCMIKVRVEREHEGSKSPEVTSGRGGRGTLRRSSIGNF